MSMPLSILRVISLFAISLISTHAIGQNMLSNGGFEAPGFKYDGGYPNFRYLEPGVNSTLADWIVSDNGIGPKSYIYHSSRYNVTSGNYALTLSEGSSVATGFFAARNTTFDLALNLTWSTGCSICFQPLPLEILVDGKNIAAFQGIGSIWSNPDMTNTYAAKFEVAAGNHTLALGNPQYLGDYREYRIDQVVLTAAPVPEPSMAMLLLAGVGALGAVAGRRRARGMPTAS